MTRYIYAGRDDGVLLRSSDDGANWTTVYTHAAEVQGLATLRNVLYAAVGASVLRSDDDGANWATVYTASGDTPYIWKLLNLNDVLYALGEDAGNSYTGYIARSVNGADWTKVLAPTPGVGLPVGADTVGSTLYAAFQYCDDTNYPTDKASQVWQSTNGGTTWTRTGQTGQFIFFSYIYHDGKHWSGRTSSGIYYSADADTWTLVSSTPTSAELWDDKATMFALAADLYRSVDDGANWTAEETAGHYINRPITKTLAGTFLAGAGSGIYRSTDGGDTWTSVHNEATLSLAVAKGPGRAFWSIG